MNTTARHLFTSFLLSGLLFSTIGCTTEKEDAPKQKEEAPQIDALQTYWQPILMDVQITGIKESPVAGIWEVQAGSHVFYTNASGDKLIMGDILSLHNNEPINLTEQEREQTRIQQIKSLNPEDFITYPAKNPQHDIYVFTDADCGYCRKFHEQRAAINDAGISVHYLAMPRTPPDTPSYNKAIAIWCAPDRQAALTEAKTDAFKDTDKTCEAGQKIVEADVALARDLGAQGTPTIILDDGKLIPGYVTVDELTAYFSGLDEQNKK